MNKDRINWDRSMLLAWNSFYDERLDLKQYGMHTRFAVFVLGQFPKVVRERFTMTDMNIEVAAFTKALERRESGLPNIPKFYRMQGASFGAARRLLGVGPVKRPSASDSPDRYAPKVTGSRLAEELVSTIGPAVSFYEELRDLDDKLHVLLTKRDEIKDSLNALVFLLPSAGALLAKYSSHKPQRKKAGNTEPVLAVAT